MKKSVKDRYFSIFHYEKAAKPIFNIVKKSITKKSRILEIGCGEGHLLEFLSKSAKSVIAIEKSDIILAAAKKAGHLKNIEFHNHHFLGCPISFKINVAIAVNSLFEGDYEEISANLSKVYSILSPDGTFIGVFPSMEAMAYLAYLHLFALASAKGDINLNVKRINADFFTNHKFDFLGNHVAGKRKQKLFYSSELELLLHILGFKKVEIQKLHYPWEALIDAGTRLHFKGQEPFWGWLVSAKK